MNVSAADLLPKANELARSWHARLQEPAKTPVGADITLVEAELPANWIEAVSALVTLALEANERIQVVVPDDNDLPELSNALDIELRPLCLVLPGIAFAVPITLRATLSLLRSRLTREHEANTPWAAQLERLADQPETWEAAQAWSSSNTPTGWPSDIGSLFPAHIMPAEQAHALEMQAADITVLVAAERLSADMRESFSTQGRILVLSRSAASIGASVPMVLDENARLRRELEMLAQEVADLELEFATVQGEMAGFTRRYYEIVGARMVELDTLQAKLSVLRAENLPQESAASAAAQAAAKESRARAERSHQEQQRFAEADAADEDTTPLEQPFRPSADLRKLFRKIAQKIHPDRAASENERAWRTQLMSEANRAYRNGDETALHEVLSLWNEGPRETVSVSSDGMAALTLSLTRQVEQMHQRLHAIQHELDQLLGSRLYELFIAARLARRQERDLLKEMADLLNLQIDGAKQQLASEEASASSND